jgi:hypothetical protein
MLIRWREPNEDMKEEKKKKSFQTALFGAK